jgi:transcriptional regulator
VEVEIARLEGKWKMSQNRPAADIAGVIDGLRADGVDDVAAVVEERRPASKR